MMLSLRNEVILEGSRFDRWPDKKNIAINSRQIQTFKFVEDLSGLRTFRAHTTTAEQMHSAATE
jgi:hypothetical protein